MGAPEGAARARPGQRPRVGFLGVGWIGRNRLQAMQQTGDIDVVGLADPSPDVLAAAALLAPDAACVATLNALLAVGIDGVVIATPSALHAEQSIQALRSGVAVFCQKPLGRTAAEVGSVLDAARSADRLLGVDLSYRFTEGMRQVRDLVRSGELGRVYAVDLVFHNAYGPDKPWFYDPMLSGGGCVVDLGVHMVDLALWVLDFPRVGEVSSRLFAAGEPLDGRTDLAEDYALAALELEGGAALRLACSWRLQAGCDAIISASFFGTQGGAAFRNVNGSFYDFTAERYRGTARETLADPPDAWGGRATQDWARRLAGGERYAGEVEKLRDVACVLDRIYRRGG